MSASEVSPVHLLTGFLGSGKTTLLQRLLRDPSLADTAVLINEYGEVGLDHHLLERIDDTVVMLASGCVCCTIRGELAEAIKALHGKRARGDVPAFRRLVIESTGLADPFPILSTLRADPVLRHHFRVASVVATVDAVNAGRQLDAQPEALRQIAAADALVLTKTDLVPPEQAASLRLRLGQVNPAASLWCAAEDGIPATDLLRDAASDVARVAEHHHAHEHATDISTFSLTFEQKLDWTRFGLWLTLLLHRHGGAVLRVKGILNLDGTEAPVAIHGVQHLVHPPVHMRAWPDQDRRSRLVFIVKGLDRALIERSLRAFCGIRHSQAYM